MGRGVSHGEGSRRSEGMAIRNARPVSERGTQRSTMVARRAASDTGVLGGSSTQELLPAKNLFGFRGNQRRLGRCGVDAEHTATHHRLGKPLVSIRNPVKSGFLYVGPCSLPLRGRVRVGVNCSLRFPAVSLPGARYRLRRGGGRCGGIRPGCRRAAAASPRR